MPQDQSIESLLQNLEPELLADNYVYLSIDPGTISEFSDLKPFARITEDEGVTLIVTQQQADTAKLSYLQTFRLITLHVYSSLEAVGLTAAVASALAKKAIPANMIAGFHHDHILVPSDRAEDAIAVLLKLIPDAHAPG